MGIRGFETFLKSNKNFVQQIDIRVEIQKWRRKHGKNPTIIIDLKEVNKVLGDRANRHQSFEDALVHGGRYQKFNEILEYFFAEIKRAGANLVFISRLIEVRYNDITAFRSSSLHPNERLYYNLLHSIWSKYGELHVIYGLDKCAILTYARDNRDNVMALITRNTEFLIYDGDYQFWSLTNVDFRFLKIARFDRKKIYESRELNAQQMKLMLAISELNPITKRKLVEQRDSKLETLISYVKRLRCGHNGYDIAQLGANLTEDEHNQFRNEMDNVLKINNYSGNFNNDIYEGLILDLVNNDKSFDIMLQFCKENLYFAYKLINETSTIPKDLLFIDISQPDATKFIDLVIKVTMKMCGIIFNDVDTDKQPKTRSVKIKRIPNEGAVQSEVDIIYPKMPLPSINDLIMEDKLFDKFRWSVLCWLLDVRKRTMTKIRNSQFSKHIRIASLTLHFLKQHGIIAEDVADAILQVETDVQIKIRPQNSRVPPPKPQWSWHNVETSWIQTAHKYTIAYELVCHCLEISGLRNETDLIHFDAYKFYARMRIMGKNP